jgi:hypothetical protein
MFALECFHDFIYQDMKKVKHTLEKDMDLPMCVCVPDVLARGMFGCELSLIVINVILPFISRSSKWSLF